LLHLGENSGYILQVCRENWFLLEPEETSSIISAILEDDRNRTLDMKLVLSVPPIRLLLNSQQLKHKLKYVTIQYCEMLVAPCPEAQISIYLNA